MEQKHISWPSIGQFRNVIKDIRSNCDYHKEPYPTLTFTGTVKLHGTNHAVCFDPKAKQIYTQSRERITTPQDDNAGSSAWTFANQDKFVKLFERIQSKFDTENSIIQVYGEWCGGNIQKGVGISNLPKMFVVFGIRSSEDSDSQAFFSDADVLTLCYDLFYVSAAFQKHTLSINFANPELV
jgi:hypothetical protein